MTPKQLPEEIYVDYENEGAADEMLVAAADGAELVEKEETKRIAVYRRVGYIEVRNSTTSSALMRIG